jgi:hypothetical protein
MQVSDYRVLLSKLHRYAYNKPPIPEEASLNRACRNTATRASLSLCCRAASTTLHTNSACNSECKQGPIQNTQGCGIHSIVLCYSGLGAHCMRMSQFFLCANMPQYQGGLQTRMKKLDQKSKRLPNGLVLNRFACACCERNQAVDAVDAAWDFMGEAWASDD